MMVGVGGEGQIKCINTFLIKLRSTRANAFSLSMDIRVKAYYFV